MPKPKAARQVRCVVLPEPSAILELPTHQLRNCNETSSVVRIAIEESRPRVLHHRDKSRRLLSCPGSARTLRPSMILSMMSGEKEATRLSAHFLFVCCWLVVGSKGSSIPNVCFQRR